MPCAKCAAKTKGTTLATSGVKKKNEMYLGSTTSGASSKSATLGNTGISKSTKKNPYAAYGGSCEKCKKKIEKGNSFCNGCAYKQNACSICGKGLNAGGVGGSKASAITGQKFSSK